VVDVAGAAGVVEVLLDEPQPLAASRPASTVSIETVATAWCLIGAAAFRLTVRSSVRGARG
jgi:hypothetical protein